MIETCSECGWTGPDESGQYHHLDCPWVDEDFDRLKEPRPRMTKCECGKELVPVPVTVWFCSECGEHYE